MTQPITIEQMVEQAGGYVFGISRETFVEKGDVRMSPDQLLAYTKAVQAEPLAALNECKDVFDTPDHPGINDTVWVTGNRPETLYDCVCATLSSAKRLVGE